MAWIEIGGALFNLVNAHRVHVRKLNELSRALMIDDHEAFVGSIDEVRFVYTAIIEKLKGTTDVVGAAELLNAAAEIKAQQAVVPTPE